MGDVTPIVKTGRKKGRKKSGPLVKCDTLFGQIVRSTGVCAGRCEGKPSGVLQCAHGFSRRYRATRWDERNAWCLCQGCHLYWTLRPLEWDDWMRSELGDTYDELRGLALNGRNPDMAETLTRLQARWDALRSAA